MPGLNRQYRWPRLLAKLFDLKGSAPDLQVLDDILPVAPLFDPTDTEHHFGRNEMLWARSSGMGAGGAGNYATVQVWTSPGYITVVEGCIAFGHAGALDTFIQLNTAPAAASSVSVKLMDCRFEMATAPGVKIYQYTPAATVSEPAIRTQIAAATPVSFPIGIVLDEDDLLTIQANTANQALYWTLFGYDRPAEASEKG